MRFGNRKLTSSPPLLIGAWLGVALPLLVLAALAEDVAERETFRFDDPILRWLHAHSNGFLDGAMLFASQVGGGALLLVSALWCAVLLALKRPQAARFVLLSMGGTIALNLSAKLLFARTRPALWLSLAPKSDYSFPSGHAMLSSAFVLTGLVMLWRSKASSAVKRVVSVLGFCFVMTVGLSRLYLGVHFPSDVLAGWMASLAWVALLGILSDKT